MSDILNAWGERWNKRARARVAYDPRDEELSPPPIPFGVPALDSMLGGGLPRGKLTILYGEPSSGKTLLSLLAVAAAQRGGGQAMFFDIERCWDASWAALVGVDTSQERLLVVRPRSLEQAFDMAIDAMENTKPDILVMDSISAMVPADMLSANMEDKDFRGLAARKMTEGVAKSIAHNESTALVVINQLRMDMGISFGSAERLPGGKGLRFYAAAMLRCRRGKWLTDRGGEVEEVDFTTVSGKEARRIGFVLRVRLEKSKVSSATWQEAELDFLFSGAVDSVGSTAHLAIQRGVIQQSGSYFLLPDGTRAHGFDALKSTLRGSPDLYERVVTLLKEVC